MENFPGGRRPPELSPEESAKRWRIASVVCAVVGGFFIGDTIKMIETGYDVQSQFPPLVVEGALVAASIFCNDRSNQLRQIINQDR